MTNSLPLVSVLMTAYNREIYIAQAIESVLQSTYTNFELIIVDDGSTDSTLSIAKKYAEADERVYIYQNETNLGDYNNRNRAASLAKGMLYKYLDSDDVIYPCSIEIMVNYYLKYPHIGYIFCDYLNQDDSKPFPIEYSSYMAYKEHFLDTHLFYAGPGGTLIPANVFKDVGGFSGSRHLGDTELWLKIALKYSILKIQTSLIWWRIHSNQEAALEQKNTSIIGSRYNLMRLYVSKSSLTDSEKKKALLILEKNFARQILKLVLHLKFKEANRLLVDCSFKWFNLFMALDVSNRLKKILSRNC